MSVENGVINGAATGPSYASYVVNYTWSLISKTTSGWTIRVTAVFKGSGADSAMYSWGHTATVTIGGVTSTIYKQVTISDNGSQEMGSVDIVVPLTAAHPLAFSASCPIRVSWSSGTTTAAGSLDVPYPYSNCGAPTSISLSSTLVKAGAGATLSWSGATSGISNGIVGYDIYWSSLSGGAYSYYKNVSTSSASGSTSVIASTSAGEVYYFKIITVGQQSGYNSSYSAASSGLVSNTPPGIPSYTYTNSKNTGTVIPASGGTITVTLTAGSSNNSGQHSLVQYSTNNSNWYTYSTALSTTSAKTWYFRTYDGIDYSGTTSLSVTQNSYPTISCTATATDSPSSSSSMSKICNLSFSNLTSGDVVRIYLKRGTSSTNPTGEYEFLSSFTASGSTYSLNSYDIVSKLSGSFFGQYYKLYVTATDTYDSSGYKTVTLKNTTTSVSHTTFYFGSLPTFTSIRRVGSGTDGYFHDSLTINYTGNIFSSMELRYTSESSFNNTNYLSSISNSSVSASFFEKSNLFTQGISYNFYIKATLGTETVYIGPKSLTKASSFSFANLSKTDGDCYVIEDEDGKKDIYQEISFATSITTANCLNAFTLNSSNNLKLKVIYGSNEFYVPFAYTISESTLTLRIQNNALYSFSLDGTGENPFNLSIHDRVSSTLQLSIVNSFGMISHSIEVPLIIDLTYKPKLLDNSVLKVKVLKKSNDTSIFSESNQYLNEGNQIKLQFSPVKAYIGETIIAKSYIGEYTELSSAVVYQSEPFSTQSFGGYPGTGSIILQEPDSVFEVPIINSPKRYKIKTIYTNNQNQSVELISSMVLNVNQYEKVTGEISSLVANYNADNTLQNISVNFKVFNLGGSGYSSYENDDISLIQGLYKVQVSASSEDGDTSIISYSTDSSSSNALDDLLNEQENTIIIVPSSEEVQKGSFFIKLSTVSYIDTIQENSEDYYTSPKENDFSKLNIFLSTGPAFSIRKGGVSINSSLGNDEAFSVGPGKFAKTNVNFHGLSSVDIVIDCGTW